MSEFLKSNPVTNLDATPIVQNTSGEGAPGKMFANGDYIAPTTNVAQYSTYRMCRFPSNSKVKHVWLYTKGVDTTTAPAGLDVNVAFSDAFDGTPQGLQGTIPSSRRDGTAYAYGTGVTATGYSTAYTSSATGNKLFGVSLTCGSAGAPLLREITFANTSTTAGTLGYRYQDSVDDMWDVLGFTNAAGVAQDPGGFFDLFVVMSGAVGTAATGTIGLEIDYIL